MLSDETLLSVRVYEEYRIGFRMFFTPLSPVVIFAEKSVNVWTFNSAKVLLAQMVAFNSGEASCTRGWHVHPLSVVQSA